MSPAWDLSMAKAAPPVPEHTNPSIPQCLLLNNGPLAFPSLTMVVFGMEHLERSSKQGKPEAELQSSLSTAGLREQQLLVPLQH